MEKQDAPRKRFSWCFLPGVANDGGTAENVLCDTVSRTRKAVCVCMKEQIQYCTTDYHL